MGRPRRYCSNACRQKAYRSRRGPVDGLAPGAYRSGEGWALYVGHARQVLDVLAESSVQTIVTSPPYFNLRDYRGNPDQIGLEPTPAAYVDALVDVFRASARVLRRDGTLWLNIGDTYSSRANRGASADRHAGRGHRRGVTAARANTVATAPMKSLLLIPCIEASTRPGDLVLDPFAGRSTTGRAALSRGRRYLGIDVNAADHDAAAEGLTRITEQGRLVDL